MLVRIAATRYDGQSFASVDRRREKMQMATVEYPSLLDHVDRLRLDASGRIAAAQKAKMGQFLTPAPVARLMASMLSSDGDDVRLLDAGAGIGSLLAACVFEFCQRPRRPRRITVTAYEADKQLASYLPAMFRLCREECARVGIAFQGEVLAADFIRSAVDLLKPGLFRSVERPRFNCAILNPPYRKINAGSEERRLLRMIGVETSNLYSGFVAATQQLLEPSGELVAIIPRSFCNGPYYRSFRRSFLEAMSLRRLHLFDSRKLAFHDDDVLQENVILHADKKPDSGNDPDSMLLTHSVGPGDALLSSRQVRYEDVVSPDDPESFIRIISSDRNQQVAERMRRLPCALDDLGISVSTGRVVQFRATQSLRRHFEERTVPLIHPAHVRNGAVTWPQEPARKPDAVAVMEQSAGLLVPNENYVLVKRFSSKEEPRRVVAAVYEGSRISASAVGFENHLNYFHRNGHGLELPLARGLAAFLNSTLVDEYFRQFNGHTQVNATDLRSIKYPHPDRLTTLGRETPARFPDQHRLDQIVEKVLSVYLGEISWETDVWLADSPTHLIHFDGEKYLDPHSPPSATTSPTTL